MKLLTIFITLLMWSVNAHTEEIDTQKQALIEKLLQQTGNSSEQISRQFSNLFIRQMELSLKTTNPDVDPKAFKIMEEEINAVIKEELLSGNQFSKLLYPIYAKKFTSEELQQMIEFNSTPLGEKMIRVMPQITQEAMFIGQAYGQKLVPKIKARVVQRFKKEGIK